MASPAGFKVGDAFLEGACTPHTLLHTARAEGRKSVQDQLLEIHKASHANEFLHLLHTLSRRAFLQMLARWTIQKTQGKQATDVHLVPEEEPLCSLQGIETLCGVLSAHSTSVDEFFAQEVSPLLATAAALPVEENKEDDAYLADAAPQEALVLKLPLKPRSAAPLLVLLIQAVQLADSEREILKAFVKSFVARCVLPHNLTSSDYTVGSQLAAMKGWHMETVLKEITNCMPESYKHKCTLFPAQKFVSLAQAYGDFESQRRLTWRRNDLREFFNELRTAQDSAMVETYGVQLDPASNPATSRLKFTIAQVNEQVVTLIKKMGSKVPERAQSVWAALVAHLAPDLFKLPDSAPTGLASVADEVVALVYTELYMRCPDSVAPFLEKNYFTACFRNWIKDPHNPFTWCVALLRALTLLSNEIPDAYCRFNLDLDFQYPCVRTMESDALKRSTSGDETEKLVRLMTQPTLSLLCMDFCNIVTLENPQVSIVTKYRFLNDYASDDAPTLAGGRYHDISDTVKCLNNVLIEVIPQNLIAK